MTATNQQDSHKTCDFFACYQLMTGKCPYLANSKYRPEPDSQAGDELFDNNFGLWLEKHGVVLEQYNTSKGFEAIIDLNKLKPAIMGYAERLAAKRAVEARIDENKQIYATYPFDEEDSMVDAKRQARGEKPLDTLVRYLDNRIATLTKEAES